MRGKWCWETGGGRKNGKMRETGDKGKKGEQGERSRGREKGEEEWEKTPVLPLIDSGTVFVFLESQMHITPLSFEN
jgi:hypothetical protein